MAARYAGLSDTHTLALTGPNEPGEPLLVLGLLTDSATGKPIPNWPVTVYHSDASGSYGGTDPNDESSARLKGQVITDSTGRFRITTVLPGEANQHVHLGVTGANPEAYDLYFSQLIGFGLRRWAESSSQAFVVDLYRMDSRQLILQANIVARGLSL